MSPDRAALHRAVIGALAAVTESLLCIDGEAVSVYVDEAKLVDTLLDSKEHTFEFTAQMFPGVHAWCRHFSSDNAWYFVTRMGEALMRQPRDVRYTWSGKTATAVVTAVFVETAKREWVFVKDTSDHVVPVCGSSYSLLKEWEKTKLMQALLHPALLTVNGYDVHSWGESIFSVVADMYSPKVFTFASPAPRWAREGSQPPLTVEFAEAIVAYIAATVGLLAVGVETTSESSVLRCEAKFVRYF